VYGCQMALASDQRDAGASAVSSRSRSSKDISGATTTYHKSLADLKARYTQIFYPPLDNQFRRGLMYLMTT
jgi:hypothetical protein